MEQKQKYKETKKRSITKVLLLRVIVFIVITFFVVVVFGETIEEGIGFALLDIGIEVVTHYVYERIWQKIEWGIVLKEENDPDKTYNVIMRPSLPNIVEEDNNV